jgi:hypothetical protein
MLRNVALDLRISRWHLEERQDYLLSGNPSQIASVVLTTKSQSLTTFHHICMCCFIQDHTNRQIQKGLGRLKGILGKDERYSYNEVKRSLYTEKRKSLSIMRMRDQ